MPSLTARITIAIAAGGAGLALSGVEAFAHASERGHVLLLPTGYYLVGGAAAVALSFVVLGFLPAAPLDSLFRRTRLLGSLPDWPRVAGSLLSFAFFAALAYAGLTGSRDPLANALPLFIWTILWVGLTLVCGIFGDVWRWLNPWYGPWRLAAGAFPRLRRPLLRLAAPPGRWPAVAMLFAFAWFELVDPAPDDPTRLAVIVAIYWSVTFLGILIAGYDRWTTRVDFLSLFFANIAKLSIVEGRRVGGGWRFRLGLPGFKAVTAPPLGPSGVVFLLLSLASVSFDGFMRTFTWLGWIGVNPLEFPGRSALVLADTAGLLGMFLALSAAFCASVLLGERLAGNDGAPSRAAGLMIWSIVPISLAYHFAHYLSSLPVNAQYFWVALSDPFWLGWNLFGGADVHVHAGIMLGADAAWTIWNLQAAAIVLGHMLAVALAHVIAWRLHGTSRKASLSQLPLAVLMVAYTIFGLWLLSTPSLG